MSDCPPTELSGVHVEGLPDGGAIYRDVRTGEVLRIDGPPTYWIESTDHTHWTKKLACTTK